MILKSGPQITRSLSIPLLLALGLATIGCSTDAVSTPFLGKRSPSGTGTSSTSSSGPSSPTSGIGGAQTSTPQVYSLLVTPLQPVAYLPPIGGGSGPLASTVQLTAIQTMTDSSTNSNVVWSSSNPAEATVSSTGLVTVVSGATAGTVTLTATSNLNASFTTGVVVQIRSAGNLDVTVN